MGGAQVRAGASKLLGPVPAAHPLPQGVHLPVYFQAGVGARSPGFRLQLCFLYPPTITVTLGGLLPILVLDFYVSKTRAPDQ